MTLNLRKIMLIALLVLAAVFSITIIAPWASSAKTHASSIRQTESMTADVLTLSGGAAATSATLSIIFLIEKNIFFSSLF